MSVVARSGFCAVVAAVVVFVSVVVVAVVNISSVCVFLCVSGCFLRGL